MDNDDALWEEWQQHYQHQDPPIGPEKICRDVGIVDKDAYEKAWLKILYVMKDPNEKKAVNLHESVVEMISKNSPRGLWIMTARWSTGLLNRFPRLDEVEETELMKQSLKKIAAINLKKTCGEATVPPSVISAYASRDRELLVKQIRQISPNIIIACGTFDILVWLLNLQVNPELQGSPAEKRSPAYCKEMSVWIIPHRHPSYARRESYNSLKETVEKIPEHLLRQACGPDGELHGPGV